MKPVSARITGGLNVLTDGQADLGVKAVTHTTGAARADDGGRGVARVVPIGHVVDLEQRIDEAHGR